MTPDIRYVAGIIDGEGYVSIDRNAKLGRSFVGKIVVQMASSILPRLLQRNFGGNYRTYKRLNPNQSDAHTWCLNGTQTLPFIKKILPYLILKKKQAVLVQKLYESKDKRAVRTHPTEYRLRHELRLYLEAKRLCTRKGRRKKASE